MASCTGDVVEPDLVRPAGRLPAGVRRELARRAGARVRELADGCRLVGLADVAEDGDVGPPTVVLSVAALAAGPAPGAALQRAYATVGEEGVLVALEPYRPPGVRGWVADRAAGTARARYGVRVDLAVPALVREAGFVISSIERFTMPTRVLPLRPFVEIVARPLPGPGRPGRAQLTDTPIGGSGR